MPCSVVVTFYPVIHFTMEEPSGVPDSGARSWIEGEDSEILGDGEEGWGIDLSLVGKLLSNKPFNKASLRVAIYRSWHFVKNLVMEEVEGDTCIFHFSSGGMQTNNVFWNNLHGT